MEPIVPAIGSPQKSYKKAFGYRGFATIEGESLTEEQRRLNAQAMEHMAKFNQIVYSDVNDRFPNWRQQYKEFE